MAKAAAETAKTETKLRYKGFVRNGDVLHGPITVQKRTFTFNGKTRSVISLILPSEAVLEFGTKTDEKSSVQYLAELAEGTEIYSRKPREYK